MMMLIRVIRMSAVSEDLSELKNLEADGWNMRDFSTRREPIVIASKDVNLCDFFFSKPELLAVPQSPCLLLSY